MEGEKTSRNTGGEKRMEKRWRGRDKEDEAWQRTRRRGGRKRLPVQRLGFIQ